ncbi:MAG: hypothetical protein ACKOQM_15415 [Novosphingobium sp.]
MKLVKHLAIAASAFALTANPVLAADAKTAPARAAAPMEQSEQLFSNDGDGWILWALLGIAVAVGLVLALDGPASP